jgi:hypothetical protein
VSNIDGRAATAPFAQAPASTSPRSSSGASRLCGRRARSSTHGPRRSNGSRPRSPNSGNGSPSGTKPWPSQRRSRRSLSPGSRPARRDRVAAGTGCRPQQRPPPASRPVTGTSTLLLPAGLRVGGKCLGRGRADELEVAQRRWSASIAFPPTVVGLHVKCGQWGDYVCHHTRFLDAFNPLRRPNHRAACRARSRLGGVPEPVQD